MKKKRELNVLNLGEKGKILQQIYFEMPTNHITRNLLVYHPEKRREIEVSYKRD